MIQQMMKENVSMFKANMLLSLCSPPRLEHGGVGRLRPGLQKCKCLFSWITTHSLFRWTLHLFWWRVIYFDEVSFILMKTHLFWWRLIYFDEESHLFWWRVIYFDEESFILMKSHLFEDTCWQQSIWLKSWWWEDPWEHEPLQRDNGWTWLLEGHVHMVGSNNKGDKVRGGTCHGQGQVH